VQPSISHQTFISAPITANSELVIEDEKYYKQENMEDWKRKLQTVNECDFSPWITKGRMGESKWRYFRQANTCNLNLKGISLLSENPQPYYKIKN
jgi:hypothetical protein